MGFNLNDMTDRQRAIALQLDGADSVGTSSSLDKLSRRYGNVKKSFLEAWARYVFPAKILSWVCNIASGLGLFYIVAMILEDFPIPYGNLVIAGLVLAGFEWCKREASDSFWDYYWMNGKKISWTRGGTNFGLFGISLVATLFGMHYLITETTPGAAKMDYSQNVVALDLREDIRENEGKVAKIMADKKALRADKANYNSKGEFYHLHAKTEQKLTDQATAIEATIASMRTELKDKHGMVDIKNVEIVQAWEGRRDVRVSAALFSCLLLEILFEICMGFLSLFDWRRFQLLIRLEKADLLTPRPTTKNGTLRPRMAT
jgi:uncharacterized protein YacL (UPF0231 family)